jgi:CheY-like chemotaxis protein
MPPPATALPRGPDFDPPLVLIVDDDPLIRRSLPRTLGPLGYRVLAFESGLHAIEAIRSGTKASCVIADLRMDGPDGSMLLAWIAEHRPRWGRVLFTAYASDVESLSEHAIVPKTSPGYELAAAVYEEIKLRSRVAP